eukprot:Colp12_sorted_trinity150504_noHs@13598
MLDTVRVNFEGSMQPLANLAQVTATDASALLVNCYDDAALPAVDAAIRDANLGLNPTRQGKTLRVPIPKMTQDLRQSLVKNAKDACENQKGQLRVVRQKALGELKKLAKVISKDELQRYEKEIDNIHKNYVGKLDTLLKTKSNEILTK